MRRLNAMTLEELQVFFKELGEPKFRAEQLFHFFHGEGKTDLEENTVFSQKLKDKILQAGEIGTCRFEHVFKSRDGSEKALMRLEDGNIVETVFMPYEDYNTICISSQVGCRMGCSFCASTKAKFVRNLSADELLSQIYLFEKRKNGRIDNIVVMGIGEPLDNLEELLRFADLIHHEKGHGTSYRNITVSTCGLVPEIRALADAGRKINLAISLHYAFDEKRARFMPIAKRYSVEEVLDAAEYYFKKTGRRVSLEYVVIKDLNDGEEDVQELKRIIRGRDFHINLIPLNPIKEFDYEGSKTIDAFRNALLRAGINTTTRQKRGDDIDAACGQLRIDYQKGESV